MKATTLSAPSVKPARSWDEVQRDPRVETAWSELGTGDGYWVTLKNGFADLSDDPCQPTHTIHEWTVKDILRRMRDVEPCTCKDCQPSTQGHQ